MFISAKRHELLLTQAREALAVERVRREAAVADCAETKLQHEKQIHYSREELAAERARRELLTTENAGLRMQANLQWVRILQLEKERAILFREVTQLPMPVPEVANLPVQTSADHLLQNYQSMFTHIEDDDERQEQGERIPTS